MCNMVIFLENFGAHFHTIRTGTLTPEFEPFETFPHFFFKNQILLVNFPVLNVSKWAPFFLQHRSKKKRCCTKYPGRGAQKKIKSEIHPGYYLPMSSSKISHAKLKKKFI